MALFKCNGRPWISKTGNLYVMTSNTTPAPFVCIGDSYDLSQGQWWNAFDNSMSLDNILWSQNGNTFGWVGILFNKPIKVEEIVWGAGCNNEDRPSEEPAEVKSLDLCLLINNQEIPIDYVSCPADGKYNYIWHSGQGTPESWTVTVPEEYASQECWGIKIKKGRYNVGGWGKYIWYMCQVTKWKEKQ